MEFNMKQSNENESQLAPMKQKIKQCKYKITYNASDEHETGNNQKQVAGYWLHNFVFIYLTLLNLTIIP